MSKTQQLGEFCTVSNTLRDHKFEANELIVGWIKVDGEVTQLALTENELHRPKDRAKENREDLPTLAVNPPSWEEVSKLEEELAEAREMVEALKNRGLWARIKNVIPDLRGKTGKEA